MMSGHRPWPMARKNKPRPGQAGTVRTWEGPFRELPEPVIQRLLSALDRNRISDDAVQELLDWAQSASAAVTLSWEEIL